MIKDFLCNSKNKLSFQFHSATEDNVLFKDKQQAKLKRKSHKNLKTIYLKYSNPSALSVALHYTPVQLLLHGLLTRIQT